MTTDTHWNDKAVVVTGGARGQGAALVQRLLAAGATVHVVDRLEAGDPAWAALAEGPSAGRLAAWPATDVADPQAWERLAAELRNGPTLVGLVNNAGITGPRNTVTRTVLDDWERVMAVNLTGSMLGIRALAPLMRHGGSIVNISSTAGMTGYYSAAYSCSKWALRGLTRSAAMELAPQGVRVNSVCPGVVDTEMIRNSPALVAALQHIIPMQAMAEAGEIADAVMFLLGPQAAYMTGTDLVVDGGVTGGGLFWTVGQATGALGPDDKPQPTTETSP